MRKRISVFLILLFLCIIHTNNIANASLLSDGGRFNMTYVYFGETSRYTELVDNTKGSVDLVAISFFDIDENGELVLTDKYSHSFIQDMHQRGIKVVPFLSNHWNISAGRKALENRHKLAGDVVSAIELFGLDGVNVDIEGLNELDRENYVDFVRLVREKINPDKLLSVAVAANPFYIDNLWQGSYDYVKLAGYSDFFVVMTYDESWQGSMPGPVASSTFLERSINYALERVPKEKILLGIPFYGRYWKNGSSYGGYGIGLDDIEILKNRYESTEYFDETSKSPCLIV
ncbi:MAG TPA: glycoside hydrolase, partial [Clostridiaceae bacterium]|nr:glycoside hydrolase [Clostridiaceae bacterium]